MRTIRVQDLHGSRAEAAHWLCGRALHEQDDAVLLDDLGGGRVARETGRRGKQERGGGGGSAHVQLGSLADGTDHAVRWNGHSQKWRLFVSLRAVDRNDYERPQRDLKSAIGLTLVTRALVLAGSVGLVFSFGLKSSCDSLLNLEDEVKKARPARGSTRDTHATEERQRPATARTERESIVVRLKKYNN